MCMAAALIQAKKRDFAQMRRATSGRRDLAPEVLAGLDPAIQ
jgi:hypothetical protein